MCKATRHALFLVLMTGAQAFAAVGNSDDCLDAIPVLLNGSRAKDAGNPEQEFLARMAEGTAERGEVRALIDQKRSVRVYHSEARGDQRDIEPLYDKGAPDPVVIPRTTSERGRIYVVVSGEAKLTEYASSTGDVIRDQRKLVAGSILVVPPGTHYSLMALDTLKLRILTE